jgi:hypothetical protein
MEWLAENIKTIFIIGFGFIALLAIIGAVLGSGYQSVVGEAYQLVVGKSFDLKKELGVYDPAYGHPLYKLRAWRVDITYWIKDECEPLQEKIKIYFYDSKRVAEFEFHDYCLLSWTLDKIPQNGELSEHENLRILEVAQYIRNYAK